MISSSAPAIQNMTRYSHAPGPVSDRSGVSNESRNVSANRSSHSPAFQIPSIAAVHPSATTFPAAEARPANGSTKPFMMAAYPDVQVRQPARIDKSEPGQVDGAAAGGAPEAISHLSSVHCRRSQWP